ncbi:uncharacterized protein AKAW2_10430A [Aspergillus luchuensis]|uniref:Uncharacterized protein n=1 Tax=Aspergillus kawachii TaxID=1069201 RepID=A0A7R7VZY0_ASPKA|nr:uncharacterized protein AKAW2_10430A [Aspergillus luchuensis]BCR93384.1 hypothetical protein AKAW2_10430A [Aspergillus luchuensis]
MAAPSTTGQDYNQPFSILGCRPFKHFQNEFCGLVFPRYTLAKAIFLDEEMQKRMGRAVILWNYLKS